MSRDNRTKFPTELGLNIAFASLFFFGGILILVLLYQVTCAIFGRKPVETTLVRALNDQVVLKPLKREAVSSGGIVLPDTTRNSIGFARVFAVGRGKPVHGTVSMFHAPECKVGDEVAYFINRGTPFRVSGEDFTTIGSDDVLAIITRKEPENSD